jgi:GTPase involved in cell partitioning and DNA repair
MLGNELRQFNADLPNKPSLVAFTKIDSCDPGVLKALARKKPGRHKTYPISAVTGEGVPDLVREMWETMHRPPRPQKKSTTARRRK